MHSVDQQEKDSRQVRQVKKLVPHSCYDNAEKVNDLMLLKVWLTLALADDEIMQHMDNDILLLIRILKITGRIWFIGWYLYPFSLTKQWSKQRQWNISRWVKP